MRSYTTATLLLPFSVNSFAPSPTYHKLTTIPATQLHSTSISTEKENPRLSGLALQLDDGTRKSHSIAENTAFVTGFFKGLSTRDSYAALLTNLYHVYNAMEEEFDATTEETVKRMDDLRLRRVEALKSDMAFFWGENWRSAVGEMSPATQKYVKRVRDVARERPRLLIAHQYTRYLGDLFGGQMMSGMATRSLDLEDGKGTSFYEFDGIGSTRDFITEWYVKLNELDLSEEEKMDIVDEANLVFGLNIEIFEELEGSAFKAFWTILWKNFKEKVGMA